MKIRTDFVTNSSSYSTADIVVDNPILLEILHRYKAMGLFEDDSIDFEIDDDFRFNKEENYDASSIESLQACLEGIIELMPYHLDGQAVYDHDLFKDMVDELHEKEKEIMQGYKYVYWNVSDLSNNEWHDGDLYNGNVETTKELTYDKHHGEDYQCTISGEPFGDDAESFVEKIHRLNGVDIE